MKYEPEILKEDRELAAKLINRYLDSVVKMSSCNMAAELACRFLAEKHGFQTEVIAGYAAFSFGVRNGKQTGQLVSEVDPRHPTLGLLKRGMGTPSEFHAWLCPATIPEVVIDFSFRRSARALAALTGDHLDPEPPLCLWRHRSHLAPSRRLRKAGDFYYEADTEATAMVRAHLLKESTDYECHYKGMMSLTKFLLKDNVNVTTVCMGDPHFQLQPGNYVKATTAGGLDTITVRSGRGTEGYVYDSLPASHELVGHKCPACALPLKPGDATVLLVMGKNAGRTQVSPGHKQCSL